MYFSRKIFSKYTPSVFLPFSKVFTSFLLISIAFSCSNSETKTCKMGAPKAIFTDSMPTVRKHYFEVKKEQSGENVGIEMVAFDNKLLLEIEQSGCNDILQQFSFIMLGKFPEQSDDEIWKVLAIRHFRDLAKIAPQLTAFNAWADAIELVKKDLKLGEPTKVGEGFNVRIDKILSGDKATLVVRFSQK
jgi:hypothetical protein